jgi:sulfate adenylyltransferase
MSDLRLLAWGAYAPLAGFVGEADYHGIVREMRLASGALWSLPITISLNEAQAQTLRGHREVDLLAPSGEGIGLLHELELFRVDARAEMLQVYGTVDPEHPGVARVLAAGTWRVGGRVSVADPGNLELEARFPPIPPRPRPFVRRSRHVDGRRSSRSRHATRFIGPTST